MADLFKQYKIRIWMSAVNPASVVNPTGQTQIQPPSARGPGAIEHTRTSNASTSVGGFGNHAFHTEQYGKYILNTPCRYSTNIGTGSNRGRRNAPQGNTYEDGHYAFSQQLPQYPVPQNAYPQNAYPVPPYGQQMAPHMYGRSTYPNATASGSPMAFDGGYYPPAATYTASPAFNTAPSGPSSRGGYPASTSGSYMASNVGGTTYYGTAAANNNTYTTSGPGGAANYSTASGYGGQHTSGGYGTNTGYGGGSGTNATSGATGFSTSAAYDPAYAMANLSFGN